MTIFYVLFIALSVFFGYQAWKARAWVSLAGDVVFGLGCIVSLAAGPIPPARMLLMAGILLSIAGWFVRPRNRYGP